MPSDTDLPKEHLETQDAQPEGDDEADQEEDLGAEDEEDEDEYNDLRFLLPQVPDDTENVEKYRHGGFHPVHLGDRFDNDRYRIVHKLGAGGFSTVWLAYDEDEKRWVALKIVDAEHSDLTSKKNDHCRAALNGSGITDVVEHQRSFFIDGPNGRHLCLVLPVLGPSTSELSCELKSRLTPRCARRLAYQATKAVANLHAHGVCHGDVTTGNFLVSISDLDEYTEDDIYRLFGQPITGDLETESGEATGLEAPRYIVNSVNFLSATSNIIQPEIRLVDFDQSFPASSPPQKMLGTPVEFLAPEVAAGLPASPASDVWALGCCIFRFRSGSGPFESSFEVTSPADLMRYVIHTMGDDLPHGWPDPLLFDIQGQPTKDPQKGRPLPEQWDDEVRTLQGIIADIWDMPTEQEFRTGGPLKPMEKLWQPEKHLPFPSYLSEMAWNPKALKVDGVYLSGYNDEWDSIHAALPKIPEREAALLLDLLSKVFIYDPDKRITAREMLGHPWFHLDDEPDPGTPAASHKRKRSTDESEA